MKVNIHGKGIIPGIGAIPPVLNQEMSEKEIVRLLNFSNFKLYDSNTKALITKKNYRNIISNNMTTNVVEEPESILTSDDDNGVDMLQPNTPPIVIENVVEETAPVVEENVDEQTTEDTSEEVVEETVDEATEDNGDDTDEVTPEDKPKYNNNHHRNKKKHNR